LLADRSRVQARNVAEGAAERTQASPSGLKGNLGDGQVRVPQQRRGALDAPREQVAVRRYSEGFLERSREVRLGDAADARQSPHRPSLVRGAIHAVLRAQQASQQLGILTFGNHGPV
jgi:hypothetical protein